MKAAMAADAAFLLALVLKMSVAGGFVVVASLAAERGGPLIGAMVATLPISAGPAYVLLAFEHDDAFIAASALASHVTASATATFALAYAALAQRCGTAASLAGALAAFFGTWLVLHAFDWTLARGLLLTAFLFPACLVLGSRYRHAALRAPPRRWYDLPLRAGLVALLVSLVVTVSHFAGPAITGMLAVAPVVLSSLILILQPRVGGRATAAVIANAISGLFGFALSLAAFHVATIPLGAPAAMALSLAISVAWNVMVWALRRRGIPL
jgi:hypothetical protein